MYSFNQTKQNRIKIKKNRPALQHHVRGDDEFRAGEIFDGEIVAETDETDDQTDQKAQQPFHKYVLENLHFATPSPVLLEQLVLENPF